jgi:hypothetical protein
MRSTECAVTYAAADAEYFDILMRIRNVNFYLFKAPRTQKTGGREYVRMLSDRSETCGNADFVLFGNTAFDKLIGQ